ncbi:hypothetical protein HY450_00030 [Candidatus Pacearchaeota archaeon]|nr:hypothetical protein [Candidatus Pacearchaeota archaeon]
MFQRFTNTARKVLALANQEALRYNHNEIGAEHILLGLIKEDGGIAANILKNCDVDIETARQQVERISPAGSSDDVPFAKTLGRTQGVNKLIKHAAEIAEKMNHQYVGTEHLLCGLALLDDNDEDEKIKQLMRNLGLNSREIFTGIENLIGIEKEERIPEETTANYWLIPKSSMKLPRVLELHGFPIKQNEQSYDTLEVYGIAERQEDSRIVGEIKTRETKSDFASVKYNKSDTTQIAQAVHYRNVLDTLGEHYDETPQRETLVRGLRDSVSNVTELADLIEGEKRVK